MFEIRSTFQERVADFHHFWTDFDPLPIPESGIGACVDQLAGTPRNIDHGILKMSEIDSPDHANRSTYPVCLLTLP